MHYWSRQKSRKLCQENSLAGKVSYVNFSAGYHDLSLLSAQAESSEGELRQISKESRRRFEGAQAVAGDNRHGKLSESDSVVLALSCALYFFC